MVDFKLDTSGFVRNVRKSAPHSYQWDGLTPFQQGYVEALFVSAPVGSGVLDRHGAVALGFSDLAPEALGLIMEECERYCAESAIPITDFREGGAIYFDERQSGNVPDVPTAHPPLTVSIGGDGMVHLSPSHEHGAAK